MPCGQSPGAVEIGTDPAIVDRLTLTPDRMHAIAEAARDGYTKADPAALHKYFGRRLSETVRADPAAYASTVGRGFVDFMRSLTIEKPHLLALAALASAADSAGTITVLA